MTVLKKVPAEMDRAEFMSVFADLYEHSPWIAKAVYKAGLGPRHNQSEGLHAAFCEVVISSGRRRQLDLLLAHPDLAGRLAKAGNLTDSSRSEQAGAGLDQCTAEEFALFTELNDRYLARFGFPFIMAVKAAGRAEILSQFQLRVDNSVEAEFDTALEQVLKIGWFRIMDIFND